MELSRSNVELFSSNLKKKLLMPPKMKPSAFQPKIQE